MQSWKFTFHWLPPMVNTLLITTPATIAFAWLFYRFAEKPYMRKAAPRETKQEEMQPEEVTPLFGQAAPVLADEG